MKEWTRPEVTSYSWQELGLLYSPRLSPLSAAKRIRRWVYNHPPLVEELRRKGWKKGAHLLTPLQVKAIMQHLGEP
ncbi:MAG: DUF4248 domain-containing protein [Tannerellaceae bacterium]|nr:DUF4248 domain-containing protein [Tannerellaceae bacterium]